MALTDTCLSVYSRIAFARRSSAPSSEERVTRRPPPPAPAPLAPPIADESPWRRGLRAIGEGLLLTLMQITFACVVGSFHDGALSPRPAEFVKAYIGLVQFDSQWYQCIGVEGYRIDREFQAGKRGNVAFFPGYPMLAAGVQRATGWPWTICLLLTAQVACWGFWTYLLLILDRSGVSVGNSRLAAIFLAAQPAAFFLVAGYSESLFLFGLCGFIYWTDSEHPALQWLGVLHGIVMTGTRIVGLPLALYPAISAWSRQDGSDAGYSRVVSGMFQAVFASLGGIAFFAYCHWKFGEWNLYMTSQEHGWLGAPNYRALLEPETYLIEMDDWLIDGFLSPDWLSQAIVPFVILAFVVLFFVEFYTATSLPHPATGQRVGYYVLALAMFTVAAIGLFNLEYRSMIRYIFCVMVLLVIEVAHFFANEDLETGWTGAMVTWLLIVPSAIVQTVFLHRFLNGMWVA